MITFFSLKYPYLTKYKVRHSFDFFFFLLFGSLLVFETPKSVIHHVKILGKLQKCNKTWSVTILFKNRILAEKNSCLKGSRLCSVSRNVNVFNCLLDSLAHGKEEKDPTRWFSPCTPGIPLGVRTLFKSHASGPWVSHLRSECWRWNLPFCHTFIFISLGMCLSLQGEGERFVAQLIAISDFIVGTEYLL